MSRLFAGTPFDRPPTCERCSKPLAECGCPPPPVEKSLTPPGKQTAALRTEKRAKGKLVTVVRGLAAADNDLPALLARLKSACGAGGTIDGDVIEIQGDHLTRLKTLLGEAGYRVR
ncbi:MAG: translation initiation factor [Planctomycetaceae bacterium]|nr:translation initiation factor [Planctomycetaceae bacterium]